MFVPMPVLQKLLSTSSSSCSILTQFKTRSDTGTLISEVWHLSCTPNSQFTLTFVYIHTPVNNYTRKQTLFQAGNDPANSSPAAEVPVSSSNVISRRVQTPSDPTTYVFSYKCLYSCTVHFVVHLSNAQTNAHI